jgi:hypothetical protein
MSTNKPSDQPTSIPSINDADLTQVSAGGGSPVSLSYYDKNDLTNMIKSAKEAGPGSQAFVDRLTVELESRSPAEPFKMPTVWIDAPGG